MPADPSPASTAPGTLAWLQRGLGLAVLAVAAVAWWWSGEQRLSWPLRLLLLTGLLLPHAPVLALEFVLLRCFGRSAPAPAPSFMQLLRAWWGEVRMGVLTFGWRQPWQPHAEPDHLPAEARGRTGMLLVHGFVCNRGLWAPWMRRLRASGVPVVAISLEPVFGAIDDYPPLIDVAVRRLEAATGRPPLIVAHSMGGLATRAWLRAYEADARCAGVVTIGTPHQGTWLARFALSPNGRQMRQGSAWLRELAAAEPPSRRSRFTCFYGHCDNIVFPAATAMLSEADNRHLAGTAHVDLVTRPEVLAEVMRRLGE
jgi:pimeloyl-ACP methyl ester carboxylesterase